MKGKINGIIALALCLGMLVPGAAAANTTFYDVPTGHWGYQYVARAAGEGLVSGVGDRLYDPEKSLSNAEFATMVCNLLYKDEVVAYQKNQTSSAQWWEGYMNVAYTQGALANTTAGDGRASAGRWTETNAQAPINRYDMAQILANVTGVQGWDTPSSLELIAAQIKVGDWDKIPTRYQGAVAFSYAKGYLSGMDDGTFSGGQDLNRAAAAVVLCRLLDAKNAGGSGSYTNTTKLVNGKAVTEDNVYSALTALKSDYPENYSWDVIKTYKSEVLGVGYGSAAFAFMLSDKVFGTLESKTHTKPANLLVGDVVYLSSSREYVVVLEIDTKNDEFTYVASSDTRGTVSWRGVEDLDDLGKNDTIFTRYTSSTASSNTLANGKKVTVNNVLDLLDDVMDDYPRSTTWDMDERYTSNVAGSRLTGSEAFVWAMSDEIFGNLDYKELTKVYNMQPGDIIYFDADDEYGIAVDVGTDSFTYGSVTSTGRISWNRSYDLDDLGKRDIIYTRYSADGSTSSSSNTLADGSAVTAKNILNLLDEMMYDEYPKGSTFDVDARYSSQVAGTRLRGSEAFAWTISDEIFGKLEMDDHSDVYDLMVGDVVYVSEYDEFGVVVEVNSKNFVYGTVSTNGKISWNIPYLYSDWDKKNDYVYTRYSGGSVSGKLANGKAITEDNVYDLLVSNKDLYEEGEAWSNSKSYKSKLYGTVTGSEALVWTLSDAVFGSMEDTDHNDPDALEVGDVFYLYGDDVYGIVISISKSGRVTYTTTVSAKITWAETFNLDDFNTRRDIIYTRYP